MGIEVGWIDHELAAEFPELDLRYVVVAARLDASPQELRNQLADMSTRFRGSQALALPSQPVPSAYRSFYRQVGLDPEVVRNPAEAVTYERIMRGRFLSHNHVADALTSTIMETHVALGALDADTLAEPLGIRPNPDGVLVIADADHSVAALFGPPLPGFELSLRTRRVAITAVGVSGVPGWMLDHALWRVADLLGFDLDSQEDPK